MVSSHSIHWTNLAATSSPDEHMVFPKLSLTDLKSSTREPEATASQNDMEEDFQRLELKF